MWTSREELSHLTVCPTLTVIVGGSKTNNSPVISTTGVLPTGGGDEAVVVRGFSNSSRRRTSGTLTSHVVANFTSESTMKTGEWSAS